MVGIAVFRIPAEIAGAKVESVSCHSHAGLFVCTANDVRAYLKRRDGLTLETIGAARPFSIEQANSPIIGGRGTGDACKTGRS